MCQHCGGTIEFYREGELYADWNYYMCNKCGKRYILDRFTCEAEFEEDD